MSRLNCFTEEELQSLTVWQLPGFATTDATIPKMVETLPKQPPSLTVGEIELIQQQAYNEAYAQGQQEGHAKGYSEGRQQGLMAAENQQREQADQFIRLMESLSEPFKVLDEAIEQQLVTLSIAIASQLIRREIKHNPGEIIAVVRSAVAVLPVAAQKLSLYLNPADAGLVKSSLALNDTVTAWQIIEDPLLTPGGCKVTTDVSLVDATVEKRLAAVIAMVLGDERESVRPADSLSVAALSAPSLEVAAQDSVKVRCA